MASLHAWRGGNLPEKREELYADTVDLLLDQWESPKVVRGPDGQPMVAEPSLMEWLKLDRAAVRKLLEQLAFEAHRDQPNLVGTADIAPGAPGERPGRRWRTTRTSSRRGSSSTCATGPGCWWRAGSASTPSRTAPSRNTWRPAT